VIQAVLLRRLLALGLSAGLSTAVPFAFMESPVIKWSAKQLGPVIVDAAAKKIAEKRSGILD
jgi:hypothetical protein